MARGPATGSPACGTFFIRQRSSDDDNEKPQPICGRLKADRERDKVQAMRDYQAEALARQDNMIRLRALRLAKESVEAQATMVPRPAKKKAMIRVTTPARARGPLRKSS